MSCNIYAKAPPKVLTQNLGWPLYVKVHILWQGTPTIKEIPGVYKTFIYIHQSRTNCITFSNRQYLTIFNNISIFGNIQYQLSEINYDISSLRYPVSDTVYQSILAISNYFETFWFYYYYYWHERVLEELLLLKMKTTWKWRWTQKYHSMVSDKDRPILTKCHIRAHFTGPSWWTMSKYLDKNNTIISATLGQLVTNGQEYYTDEDTHWS